MSLKHSYKRNFHIHGFHSKIVIPKIHVACHCSVINKFSSKSVRASFARALVRFRRRTLPPLRVRSLVNREIYAKATRQHHCACTANRFSSVRAWLRACVSLLIAISRSSVDQAHAITARKLFGRTRHTRHTIHRTRIYL